MMNTEASAKELNDSEREQVNGGNLLKDVMHVLKRLHPFHPEPIIPSSLHPDKPLPMIPDIDIAHTESSL